MYAKIRVMQEMSFDAVRDAVMLGSRALVGIAARSLAEVSADVSLAQYRVLVLIQGLGPQTMGALAESLDVNPSTVTRVCDVLVEKGLIRRSSAQASRRSVSADLTAKGRRIVSQVMDRRARLIDDVVGKLSPAAQRRLARSLGELAEVADDSSHHAWTLGWPIDQASAS